MKLEKQAILWGIGTSISILGIFILLKRRGEQVSENIDLSIFDSPDLKGSGSCIDNKLLSMLIVLEQQSGHPIFKWISSAVRTPYWNRKVGGVGDSSHIIPKCKAVDIKVPSHQVRNELVQLAHQIGFRRFGVANTFIHLDIDETKPQHVAWGYPKGTPAPINPFIS